MNIMIKYLISGKVQGVFYRAETKEQADRLNITGTVKNLNDGRVEVIACGERDSLLKLYDWLQIGPSLAKVTDVTVEEMPLKYYTGFKVVKE